MLVCARVCVWWGWVTQFACGKHALRALSQSIAKEYGKQASKPVSTCHPVCLTSRQACVHKPLCV